VGVDFLDVLQDHFCHAFDYNHTASARCDFTTPRVGGRRITTGLHTAAPLVWRFVAVPPFLIPRCGILWSTTGGHITALFYQRPARGTRNVFSKLTHPFLEDLTKIPAVAFPSRPWYNFSEQLTGRPCHAQHHPLLPGARRAVPDASPGEKVPRRQPRQVDRRGREI